MTTPADLERSIDKLDVTAHRAMDEIDRLRAQRTELLAALKGLRDLIYTVRNVYGSAAAKFLIKTTIFQKVEKLISQAEEGL